MSLNKEVSLVTVEVEGGPCRRGCTSTVSSTDNRSQTHGKINCLKFPQYISRNLACVGVVAGNDPFQFSDRFNFERRGNYSKLPTTFFV
jgi:hypothetical protein